MPDAFEAVGNNSSCFFQPFPRSVDLVEICDNAFEGLWIDRLVAFGGLNAKKCKNDSTDQFLLLKKLSEPRGGHVNVDGEKPTDRVRGECRH